VYGYRGDQPGVAHGATAAMEDLIIEAELILHLTAAAIVHIVRKNEIERTD
jgi:hypothetical protein